MNELSDPKKYSTFSRMGETNTAFKLSDAAYVKTMTHTFKVEQPTDTLFPYVLLWLLVSERLYLLVEAAG